MRATRVILYLLGKQEKHTSQPNNMFIIINREVMRHINNPKNYDNTDKLGYFSSQIKLYLYITYTSQ